MSSFTEAKQDKIASILAKKVADGVPFISIEFFPPKTPNGINSLFNALEALKKLNPVFVDFTWGAGGSTSDLTLELCQRAKSVSHVTVCMHLTCTNMELTKIDTALDACVKSGLCNILALRGDPPLGQEVWTAKEKSLTCALDLLSHIRELHGDEFCLGVAGYPEGHPTKMTLVETMDSLTPSELRRCNIEKVEDEGGVREVIYVCRDAHFEEELAYLKKKVDAGASYIVTQMFFDVHVYEDFVVACRRVGITVPILPGIMCLSNLGGFQRMTKFCKTRVPDHLAAALAAVSAGNEDGVKQVGCEFVVDLCAQLLELGAPGLHFYTLNSSTMTLRVVQNLVEKYPKFSSLLPSHEDSSEPTSSIVVNAVL